MFLGPLESSDGAGGDAFSSRPSLTSTGRILDSGPTIKQKYFYVFRFYLFNFRQRGKEGEREGEKYQCAVASRVPPTGDPAGNPGVRGGEVQKCQGRGSLTASKALRKPQWALTHKEEGLGFHQVHETP